MRLLLLLRTDLGDYVSRWSSTLRSVIAIMVLFAPSTLHFTVDDENQALHNEASSTPLVERDSHGIVKHNLPDRLVVIANHQAYTDWMYLWIMACYAGMSHAV
jgi:lysocardiolipin and lysophospholipid acyltransferase